VVIEITEDSSRRYLRSGASGYYSARVTNPFTGEVLGGKNSIPIRGGEASELFLELSGQGWIEPISDLMIEAVRVDASQNGTEVRVGAGQVVVVTLDSNPATGYRWQVVPTKGSVVRQLGVTEFFADSELLGARGKEVLQFASTEVGEGTLELVYRPRGEAEGAHQESFRVLIVSEGIGDGQISDPLILVPGPKDDDEDPVNPKAPDIRGTITEIRQASEGRAPSVLVESGEARGNAIDKAWVSISRETKLLETSGEDFVAVSLTSLAIGQSVEVIFEGPVMESYPVQARARQFVILK
jgi:predicted secreted protein